jgi:hypothetical protein
MDFTRLRDDDRFLEVWFKRGEQMKLIQRIGFGAISLFLFSFGLFLEILALDSLRTEKSISAATLGYLFAILAGLFFLIPGVLGLRNVLRFPRI